MLKLGTENISGLYVGEQKIKKAFVGEQLVFEDNPTYTVYFYAVDEEYSSKVLNSSSFTVNPGESVSVNPWDINGYNFAGWYDESGNLVSSGSSFSVTPTGDATYYLKYYEYYTLLVSASGFVSSELVVTINGEDYTITRNADAQGHGAELHLRKNSVVTVKTKTIPSGYKFDKWGLVYANVTSTADPYTFTLTRDLEILHGYLSKASRLPAGYTELEYVQSQNRTSTASYVGCFYYLKPTGATAMRVTFSFGVALSGTAYQPIIGDLKYVNNNRRSFGLWANANGIFAMRDFSNIDTLSTSLSVGAKYTYETGCSPSVYTKWYVNESLVNTLTTGISTTFYSRSFGTIGGALSVVYNTVSSNSGLSNITYTMPRGIRLHSVQYLNADGDILLDLVPARNSSGIVGLYDTIANKFYQQSKGGIALNTATLNSDGKINANTPSANYQITAGPAV